MNTEQEEMFLQEVQKVLNRIGIVNMDAKWSALELYAAMVDYNEYEDDRAKRGL